MVRAAAGLCKPMVGPPQPGGGRAQARARGASPQREPKRAWAWLGPIGGLSQAATARETIPPRDLLPGVGSRPRSRSRPPTSCCSIALAPAGFVSFDAELPRRATTVKIVACAMQLEAGEER